MVQRSLVAQQSTSSILAFPPRPAVISAETSAPSHRILLLHCNLLWCTVWSLYPHLPAWSLQIKFEDQEFEDTVIQQEINDSHRNDPKPAGLCISLKDTEQEQIQKSAGKCQSDSNVQNMSDHIRCTCQDHLYYKQHRCYKQERKLQRLCDTGCHTCQCC